LILAASNQAHYDFDLNGILFLEISKVCEEFREDLIDLLAPHIILRLRGVMILLVDEPDGAYELSTDGIGPFTLEMGLAPHFLSDAVQIVKQEFQKRAIIELSNRCLDGIVDYRCFSLVLDFFAGP
jgi:hypothetical protein